MAAIIRSAADIASDTNAYLQDTSGIFAALKARIDDEESRLYVHAN